MSFMSHAETGGQLLSPLLCPSQVLLYVNYLSQLLSDILGTGCIWSVRVVMKISVSFQTSLACSLSPECAAWAEGNASGRARL